MKFKFQTRAQLVDGLCNRLFASLLTKDLLVDPLILLVFEMGFRNMEAIFRLAVYRTGKPKAFMPALLQNVRPFAGFK